MDVGTFTTLFELAVYAGLFIILVATVFRVVTDILG